jgi:hypothetical protein
VVFGEKCGFNLVDRKVNYEEVRGNLIDGLTFKLNENLITMQSTALFIEHDCGIFLFAVQ